jgi:hypothetical protein
MLGGRSTVGPVALNHVIGVRIPASQPAFAHTSRELRLGKQVSVSSYSLAHANARTREGCLAVARAGVCPAIGGRAEADVQHGIRTPNAHTLRVSYDHAAQIPSKHAGRESVTDVSFREPAA